jgi:uncharacterized repeat protein (TIGR03843 family)
MAYEPTPSSSPPGPALDRSAALELLGQGEIDVQGRLIDASNATLYCAVSRDGVEATCVYKPIAGERPLWDFPDGTLGLREVAAFAVSDAIGWDLVPPTVLREGPFGPGMCQLWIDVDETVDLAELVRSNHTDLRRMCVLDAVINNADRKGGHLLPTLDGRIYGVDHGVCFCTDEKLRTVLWQWRGRQIPADIIQALTDLRANLDGDLGATLADLLDPDELRMTRRRVDRLIRTKRYPQPSGDWPAVPWPPF